MLHRTSMESGTGLGINMESLSSVARPYGETPFTHAVPTTSTLEGSRIGILPEDQIDGESTRPSFVAMRSTKGMAGLLLAEVGGSMVEIDKHFSGHGSCFREGKPIEPGYVTPIQADERINPNPRTTPSSRALPHPGIGHRRGASLDQGLSRQGTLLSAQASPERRAEELKRLLGDSSAKVKSGAIICSGQAQGKKSPNAVAFEQGKSRARVSLDLTLENNIAVENGYLSGCVQVRVDPPKGCDSLSIGGGKIRIAGFEVSPGNEHRHIFYQIVMPMASISSKYGNLFASSLDNQGFGTVTEGAYSLPFSLRLPVVTSGGKPRGVVSTKCGAIIKYIAIASMKIIDPSNGKRSIAHFYRDCEIWPALDLLKTLAPAPQPIQGHASKKLFMGGDGSLSLSATLHRSIWVAGQPIHVRVQITNESRKTVRSLGLSVTCTTTTFRPSSRACGLAAFESDADTCEIETNERKIAEATLVAGQKGTKGHASAKGWWTGVGPGECASLGHCLIIPVDALTVARVRLLEVEYALRVKLNVGTLTGSSDAVHVMLPIRVVNPISLDPPPSGPMKPSSSSVIHLNTPKPYNAVGDKEETSQRPIHRRTSTYASKRPEEGCHLSSRKRVPPPLSLPDMDGRPRPSGLPVSSSTYAKANMNFPLRPTELEASRSGVLTHAPVPSYPTSHVLHDFGNLESVEDLDSVLGDIPGSVSMLEQTSVSLDLRHGSLNTGSSNSGADYYEHEELASDDEIEMMVNCASARIQDEGYFAQQLLPREGPRQLTSDKKPTTDENPVQHVETQRRREQTGNTLLKRALPPQPLADHQHVVHDATGRGRAADNQVRLTANRRRLNPSLSPKRPTFSERVQMKKMQAHQISSRGRNNVQLRESLHCDTDSDATEQSESPESLYSVAQSSATPYSETSEDDTQTMEASISSRPSNMRVREPPSDSKRHANHGPFVPSRIKSAPVRQGLHTSNITVRESEGTDISPVRRRIAMLEERTRQDIGGPRPSLSARHTSSSIPSQPYGTLRK